MQLSEIGLIGNCQLAAHVHRSGAVVWCCMARFDSPPVFGSLLDPEGGHFSIAPAGGSLGEQRYLPNTNVLETRFDTPDGSFRILDLAPRFVMYERSFRPTKIARIVEPLEGTPRIKVECRPVLGWSKNPARPEYGSHHINFHGYEDRLRLTTNVPLTYVNGEPFALTERRYFVLSWGEPVEEPLERLCEQFLRETMRYWETWVKHCEVPSIYQQEVIRSALALKLHCFEDTGAIVAALTTSIPESPGSGRTWDYRYCWLRDAYYTLGAFRLLGHFEERQQFIHFLLNVVSSAPNLELAPLYRVDGRSDLTEELLQHWAGFQGEKPVRVGNGAAEHQQHDVFGEMVLALTPLFLDARFRDQVSPPVLNLVTRLARRAVVLAGKPDAGIWEYRSEWRPQTFSSLMCWAAADRMTRIAELHKPDLVDEFTHAARKIHREILDQAVDNERGCLVADYGGREVDAALLQAIALRLWPDGGSAAFNTVQAIRNDLEVDGWLKRYRIDDGFGRPEVAFTLCTFWLVEALARVGREAEAREVLSRVQGVQAPLGLLAEDVEAHSGKMWGNFPQAYSHVGLIHAAFAAAPRWADLGS